MLSIVFLPCPLMSDVVPFLTLDTELHVGDQLTTRTAAEHGAGGTPDIVFAFYLMGADQPRLRMHSGPKGHIHVATFPRRIDFGNPAECRQLLRLVWDNPHTQEFQLWKGRHSGDSFFIEQRLEAATLVAA